MPEKLLLIGPCPPPDGGTTIPFKLFCKYVTARFASKYAISVINSTSGDKSSVSMLSPRVLIGVLPLVCRIVIYSFINDRIVIFGSQRFITLIGCLVIVLTYPFRKRVCLRINGGGFDIYYQNGGAVRKALIRQVLGKAEAIIVQTELVRGVMSSVWHAKVYAASNYRELTFSDAFERKFSDKEVRFIYTGIVRRLKGCEELLEAFVRLNEMLKERGQTIAVRLDLFGRLFDSASEPLDIRKYKTYCNISFHGQIPNDELMQQYARADILVFPSYWPTEGHPGSVIEAMMYGLPVIASNWRSIPEVIVSGVNGIFCKIKDVHSLVEAMYELAVDPAKRRFLSAGARRCALSYDHNKVCASMATHFNL